MKMCVCVCLFAEPGVLIPTNLFLSMMRFELLLLVKIVMAQW